MTKAILLLAAFVGLIYFLFYPFLKHRVGRKRLLRWIIILYAIALFVSTVNTYFLE